MKEDRILRIYTDGGCAGNQSDENLGGWGAILEFCQTRDLLFAVFNKRDVRLTVIQPIPVSSRDAVSDQTNFRFHGLRPFFS